MEMITFHGSFSPLTKHFFNLAELLRQFNDKLCATISSWRKSGAVKAFYDDALPAGSPVSGCQFSSVYGVVSIHPALPLILPAIPLMVNRN